MHFGGRLLQGFDQRALAAEHHHVRVVLEPRPLDRRLLDELHGELDIHRGLEAGADDFAFALQRVAVADEQQRAGFVDRQHHLHALVEARVVHVAAERARCAGCDRFLARRRHADAAEHRPQAQLEAADVGVVETRRPFRLVEHPVRARRLRAPFATAATTV